MPEFVVLPIPTHVATQVRDTRRSPQYGHPAHQEAARGTGPCRQCLREFQVGAEERMLFTYSPFDGVSTMRQPGPIFIHAESCAPHEGIGYPDGLRGIPLVAQAYFEDGTLAAPRTLPMDGEAAVLEALLAEPRVSFANLRHADAGCFIARVERVTHHPPYPPTSEIPHLCAATQNTDRSATTPARADQAPRAVP